MVCRYRLVVAVGIIALVGCGNPTPDGPVSGPSIGSADAVVSSPASDAPRAGLAARQVPMPPFPLGALAPFASPPDAHSTDASRGISSAPAATPADIQPPADKAQRKVRELRFEEVRENPDTTVRFQALEAWAQQPGDTINSLIVALGDEDEGVRARAEAFWEQQLVREEAETAP